MNDLCLINLLTSFSVSFFYTTPRPLSPPVPDSSPAKLYTEEGKAAVSGCAGRFVGTVPLVIIHHLLLSDSGFESHKKPSSVRTVFTTC